MLLKFTLLALFIFIAGYLLTAQLYRMRGKRLRGSKLETKILLWIPLFGAAVAFAYGDEWVRIALLAIVLLGAWLDVVGQRIWLGSVLYACAVSIGVMSLFGVAAFGTQIFLAVWSMSVLSDATAFLLAIVQANINCQAFLTVIRAGRAWPDSFLARHWVLHCWSYVLTMCQGILWQQLVLVRRLAICLIVT